MERRLKDFVKDVFNLYTVRRGGAALAGIQPPVVIGATGGSGTRVLARIAQHAGFFMGSHLNHALDSIDLDVFFRKWIPLYLAGSWGTPGSSRFTNIDRDFKAGLIRHLEQSPGQGTRWGAKNPKGIHLWSYVHQKYPQARFIHMIRDGRDMAFSSNQTQLEKYGRLYVGDSLEQAPRPIRSITFWSILNQKIADWAAQEPSVRYLRVRFEDLCSQPHTVISDVFAFLGTPEVDPDAAAAEIRPPDSIGRWRTREPELIKRLQAAGEPGLKTFGYLD